jgi:hypothetical protein
MVSAVDPYGRNLGFLGWIYIYILYIYIKYGDDQFRKSHNVSLLSKQFQRMQCKCN